VSLLAGPKNSRVSCESGDLLRITDLHPGGNFMRINWKKRKKSTAIRSATSRTPSG
jgi:hypothetical protein